MSARAFLVFIAVLGVVGLLFFGLRSNETDRLALGDPVPDRELPRLDTSGTGTLAEHRGKWVLVNHWASWCPPCREEAPALEAFQQEHGGKDFTIVGINSEDNSPDALAFVREFGLSFPLLRDKTGERRDAFGMTGFPESFLVDPDGRIALIRPGPVNEAHLEQTVEPLIEGSSEKDGTSDAS